jgi:DNA polymerase-3 subunit delta
MNSAQSDKETEAAYCPVYLIYGDEFLVKEQLAALIGRVVDPGLRGPNLALLDGANLDLSELASMLQTPSLFGGRRLIVVNDATLFAARTDRAKIIDRTCSAWRGNDRKAAFKGLSQILGLAGLNHRDMSAGDDWVAQACGNAVSATDAETLLALARAFIEAGLTAKSTVGEAAIVEIVRSGVPDDATLVFTSAGADKRKKVFKAIEEKGRVIECALKEEKRGVGLERSFFDDRVKQTLGRAGKTIGAAALEKMYSRTGKDVRRLTGELEKLMAYGGKSTEIKVQDVEEVFADFHETAFYGFTNALRSGDLAASLRALHEALEHVDHPLQILGAVANEFRRMTLAREMLFTVFKQRWKPGLSYNEFVSIAAQTRKENPQLCTQDKFNPLGLSDYPLLLLLKDAQKYPLERLIAIMESILEADLQLKSGGIGSASPERIMENLVLKICRKPQTRER